LGQVVGLSDAISNSNREVDPPGGLTNWARKRVPTSQDRVLLYEALVNRCDLFCGKRGGTSTDSWVKSG